MATYGTLQSDIADELNRADLSNQIKKAIQEAIRKYERERFFFNEGRATAATVSGEEFLSLPGDFVSEDEMMLTIGNGKIRLLKRDYEWMADMSSDVALGIPSDYCIYQNQFRLHPVPNAAYQITLAYVKRLSPLVGEADGNDWTDTGFDLIKATAKRLIYSNYLHDYNHAGQAMNNEQVAYHSLKGETEQRIMVGHAKATTW